MTSIRLFPLEGALARDPAVEGWFAKPPRELRSEARRWFAAMRSCGPDVLELLHDGHPTACVDGIALGYVNAFTDHVNVGFYLGATLDDPAGLLEGKGRFMRHVKVRPGACGDEAALRDLIRRAYDDLKARVPGESRAGRDALAAPPGVDFREITPADIPSLFRVRPMTRENAMTVEDLRRLGITPGSVEESLRQSTRGWVCTDAGEVVAFCMADRASAEFLVIAVLPAYEGRGIGGRLMALAEDWLAASGCGRAWLTTDLDTTLRAYGFYRKRGWKDWKIERGLRWMELGLPHAG